jgi:hypothetical protein
MSRQLQLEKPPAKEKEVDLKRREDALREVLLANLGEPDDLHKIHIKQLWNPNFYRINVYREAKGLARISDSFFVQCCDDGPYFSPPITFKYHDAELGKIFAGQPNSLIPLVDTEAPE